MNDQTYMNGGKEERREVLAIEACFFLENH